MKNLKFRTIVSGIMIITSGADLRAMEEKSTFGKVYDGTAAMMNAIVTGIKRQTLGNAPMLEQELATFDPTTWDDVSAGNLVNRAIKEVRNDPKKTTDLLAKLQKHNELQTATPYTISETAKGHAKNPVDHYYKTKEQEALDEAKQQMENFLNSTQRQYQAIINKGEIRKKEVGSIAKIVVLTNGPKPDSDLFERNLNKQLALPADLCAFLQRSDLKDELVIVEPSTANNAPALITSITPSDAHNNTNITKSPLPIPAPATPLMNSNASSQPAAQQDVAILPNNDKHDANKNDDDDVPAVSWVDNANQDDNNVVGKSTNNNAAVVVNTITNNNNNNKSKKGKNKKSSNNLNALAAKSNNNKSDDDSE